MPDMVPTDFCPGSLLSWTEIRTHASYKKIILQKIAYFNFFQSDLAGQLKGSLRLIPTFEGVLLEKIRTRVSFTKILANYTSEESLITADYDEK